LRGAHSHTHAAAVVFASSSGRTDANDSIIFGLFSVFHAADRPSVCPKTLRHRHYIIIITHTWLYNLPAAVYCVDKFRNENPIEHNLLLRWVYRMFHSCLEWHFFVQLKMFCIKVVNFKIQSRFWTHLLIYNLFCYTFSKIIQQLFVKINWQQRLGEAKNSTTRSPKLEYVYIIGGDEWSIQYTYIIIYYANILHEIMKNFFKWIVFTHNTIRVFLLRWLFPAILSNIIFIHIFVKYLTQP